MIRFHNVSTPRDEIAYLKLVDEYNTRLRNKHDRDFLTEHNLQTRYEKIFAPITRPLNKSLQIATAATTGAPPPPPPPQSSSSLLYPPTATSTPYHRKRTAAAAVDDSSSSIQSLDDIGDDDDMTRNYTDDDAGMNITKFFKSSHEDYGGDAARDDYFGIKKSSSSSSKKKKKKNTYTFIGKELQFDGPQSHRTGFHTITNTSPKKKQKFVIHSQRIWDMILLKYITFKPTHEEFAVYGNILISVGFNHWFRNTPRTAKKRAAETSDKYISLIEPALSAAATSGRGLYTRKSPKYYRTTAKKKKTKRGGNIEFFPANKKALQKKLVYLLGEYRSGNTVLRNEIVPIIQYLLSIGVPLPKRTTDSLNWLYD